MFDCLYVYVCVLCCGPCTLWKEISYNWIFNKAVYCILSFVGLQLSTAPDLGRRLQAIEVHHTSVITTVRLNSEFNAVLFWLWDCALLLCFQREKRINRAYTVSFFSGHDYLPHTSWAGALFNLRCSGRSLLKWTECSVVYRLAHCQEIGTFYSRGRIFANASSR